MTTTGVGIIGASPGPASWAANAHIPALRAVPEFELRAVATSRRASADAAAGLYGVPGHDDYRSLIERPDVDLVVVAVKVPRHHEIVSAALAAGKMVYCEWPLAADLGQARDLAAHAASAGVRTVVGLQGRYAPEVQAARELTASGALGRVQSTTLAGSGIAWGPRTDRDHAYLYDAANGVTTLTAAAMHALDALTYVLGPLRDVTATTAVAQQDVRLVEDGSRVKVTAPDQVAITGTLRDGVVMSAFYRGGVSAGDNLRWEISGSDGELLITSRTPGNGNLQAIELGLSVRSSGQPELTAIPAPATPSTVKVPAAPAGNVARLYAALAEDLRTGSSSVPDFNHALHQHRLVEAILEADRSGRRQYPE